MPHAVRLTLSRMGRVTPLENLQETTGRAEAKTMTREIREGLIFIIILLVFIPVLAWAFLRLSP